MIMEIMETRNELQRCGGKCGMDNNKERRLLQLLFLSFGVLCIIQATLNLALRLTFEGNDSPHTTELCGNNQLKPVNFDQNRPRCCSELQETIIALTRDRSMLEKRNEELLDIIKSLEEEKKRQNGFIS